MQNMISSQLSGFIAPLVEMNCIGIAEVMGLNPVIRLNFSGVCKRQLLKLPRQVLESLLSLV